MTDRLAEIAARAAELMTHFGPDDKGKGGGDVDDLVARVCDDDVPLLIARVRELEAQAADAKVVEAAEALKDLGTPYRNGLRAFLKMNDNNWDGYFDDGWDVAEKLEALDAALAARKQAE
jgi:hypothetical protein